MADARETLFAQVALDLARIDGSVITAQDGTVYQFANRVLEVSREVKAPEALTLPALVMVEGEEMPERQASTRDRFYTANLLVIAYDRRENFSSGEAAGRANAWIADIKRVLLGSDLWTHGDNCHAAYFAGAEPFAVDGAEWLGAYVRAKFNYSADWDSP